MGAAARTTRKPSGTGTGPVARAVSTTGSQPCSGRWRQKRTMRALPPLAIGGNGLATTSTLLRRSVMWGSRSR